MCGVSAIIDLNRSGKLESSQIEAMNQMLSHRGPDGEGLWISNCNNIHFAHKRLSIIELSDKSLQPMVSNDGRYVLVFNGEIYNYLELQKECIKLGSKFNTHSDSEVIIESFRHWGVSCFSRFRGMWAVLLYDLRQKQVVISRDPFGIKPLYYSYHNGLFYFVSEIKALTGISDYFKEEDLITSRLFLEHGYLERDDWTFYKNIKRFPHSHYCILDLDKRDSKLIFTKYWHPKVGINNNLSFKNAANKLKELFTDSMKLHLRSDVPVGACLSGGLDSSSIVSVGSGLLDNQSFTTFTSQYLSYSELDESLWAKKVINHTNANAYFTEPSRELFETSLDDLLWAQDEPFGSMSIFAQYCVFKKISETNIKVVLDGQGADEMLAGYVGYIPLYFDDLFKKRRYFTLIKELFAFRDMHIPYGVKSKILLALKKQFRNKNKLHKNSAGELVSCEDEYQFRVNKLLRDFKDFDERLEDLLLNSNIPQLLRYEDRNSMRFSIESRVPFLNIELVEFILSLPSNFRIRNGFTKAVFREAMKDILPIDVRKRKSKLGFPAPEVQWLKESFNIDTSGPGAVEWRQFIYNKWRANNVV